MVAGNQKKAELSHVAGDGSARMVDISGKSVTVRKAVASAVLSSTGPVLDALMDDALAKRDALATARVAGIQAAKRTSEWIPLCHPLSLDHVQIDFARKGADELMISCTVKTSSSTGVEMEALTGVSAAALTVYDMAKAADKSMVIGPIRLEHKSGGKSGTYQRNSGTSSAAGN